MSDESMGPEIQPPKKPYIKPRMEKELGQAERLGLTPPTQERKPTKATEGVGEVVDRTLAVAEKVVAPALAMKVLIDEADKEAEKLKQAIDGMKKETKSAPPTVVPDLEPEPVEPPLQPPGPPEAKEKKEEPSKWSQIEQRLTDIAQLKIKHGALPAEIITESTELEGQREEIWRKHKGGRIFASWKGEIPQTIDQVIERDNEAKNINLNNPAANFPRPSPVEGMLNYIDERVTRLPTDSEDGLVQRSWWRGVRRNIELACLEEEQEMREQPNIRLGRSKKLDRRISELEIFKEFLNWGDNKSATTQKWEELAAQYKQWLKDTDQSYAASSGLEDLLAKMPQRSMPGVDGDLSEAQKTFYGIPEQLPTTEVGWISAVRDRLIKLRRLGESPYAQTTWPQNIEILLSLMPDYSGKKAEIKKKLLLEAKSFQWGYKVKGVVENQSKTSEDIKSLPKALNGAGASITQDHLYNFKGMVETEVPEYLRGILGEEKVSMSLVMDRAMWLIAGFMGEWAEKQGQLLQSAEKSVAPEVRRGMFKGDPNAWDKRASDEFKRMNASLLSDPDMAILEAKYLNYLGFKTDRTLRLDGQILKAMFESMPADLRKKVEASPPHKVIQDKALAGQGARLNQLFNQKNVFCENASQLDRNYTEWLVGSLAGAEYGEIMALDFVIGTTDATKWNTTEETFGFESDSVTHLYHPDIRQIQEARKGAPAGSLHVAGRFPPVVTSMMDGMKIGDKSVLQNLREGKRFTELNWAEILTEDPMAGFAAIALQRGLITWGIITNTSADLAKELTEDGLRGLVKPLNTAWENWGAERRELVDMPKVWERREAWAASHLRGNSIKDTSALGRDNWSPWVALAVGWCYEHHPKSALLPNELASPLGVTPARAEVKDRWIKGKPDYRRESPGRYSIANERATEVAYSRFRASQLLTSSEVELVKAIVEAGKY